MHRSPFARAIAMMNLIASMGLDVALKQMGPYVSRGHGQNKQTGIGYGNHQKNWKAELKGQTNGKREMVRRRQLEAGIIHLN